MKRITVSGVVKDEAGKPLPNVNIEIKGTTIGAITNKMGEYLIMVANNAVFLYSLEGYEKQTVNVDGRYEIDIVLKKAKTDK